jgi:hypothetical protein
VGKQGSGWDKVDPEQAEDYSFFCGKENENHDYLGDGIRKSEMGRIGSMCGGEERCIQSFGVEI